MERTEMNALQLQRLTDVADGIWGTIGPCFENACREMAAFAGAKHALLVHSAQAALEAILRAKNIGFGDQVIVARWSDPVDSMTAAALGAVPVFAEVTQAAPLLTPTAVSACMTERTCAVIADIPTNPDGITELARFCEEKGLCLILNLGDIWGLTLNGKPIHSYGCAAFVDMSQGCALDLGLAGAVLSDVTADFRMIYARHDCGRDPGDGASLTFDDILGGDLRIAEWQASLLPGKLEQITPCTSARSKLTDMANAPFWQDPYYKKLTGTV